MLIVLLIYAFMALLQLPGLIRDKSRKELAAFLAFYSASFLLSLLYALDINIPSPMKSLEYVIQDMLGLKY